MENIIIIGANQGGLVAAYKLGKLGFKVSVYEAKSKDQVAYDWYDDIDPKVFAQIGFPMPDKSMYFNKKQWTFVNPSETVKVFVQGGEQANDISIERRPLNDYLYSYAVKVAEINYGVKVDSLLLDGDRITGVKIGDKEIKAGLVIDTSGVYSTFRQSLPESFKMDNATKDEVFVAFRGFFNRVEGDVDYTNKAYLKHEGQMGISWCIATDEGDVDILIGRVGSLTKQEIDHALVSLKKDNPFLGDKLLKCGYVCNIPVRYPSTNMVANGYVTLGDSAYMTIPMMGSGVVAGMIAATYLSEVLAENKDFTKENLWKYQVKFYKRFGGYVGVDMLKRWLLAVPSKNVDFLFEKHILNQETLSGGLDGSKMQLPLKSLLRIVWNGKSRLGVLLSLAGVLGKMDKAKKVAEGIPEIYDEKTVDAWSNKIKKFFNK